VSELLALVEGGAVTTGEVLCAVDEHRHDKPAVAAGLVQVFRENPDDNIRLYWIRGSRSRP
jgi:hypothetical protein